MNAFEEIIAGLFWEEGYWTHVGYKVESPKDKKVQLGIPSLPRPEIDILAYQASENRLLWVECKSYLDSKGVKASHLTGEDIKGAKRYKVFTWPKYRQIVTEELIKQVVETKISLPKPSVNYCLVTGKISTNHDRRSLHEYFVKKGWLLYDEYWIKNGLESLLRRGYEDDVAVIVAKLFARIETSNLD